MNLNTILAFVLQSEESGTTAINKRLGDSYKSYIEKEYRGFKRKVGLSAIGGRYVICHFAFTNYKQDVKNGIYPAFLYYRKIKKLILAYGISASATPATPWNWAKIGISSPCTIKDFLSTKGWKADPKYNASYVYKCYDVSHFISAYKSVDILSPTFSDDLQAIYPDFTMMDDLDTILSHYSIMFTGVATLAPAAASVPASSTTLARPAAPTIPVAPITSLKDIVRDIINSVNKSGLIYDDNLIKRFAYALLTKQFAILSGLAGSGKTQLALAFAKALVEDENKQLCVVPVGADWTNREPLLGYPNALETGKYTKPDYNVLDLLIECNKPDNQDKPYFLILDEMNMSYVERYFADFLSTMESKKAISLWDGSAIDPTPKEVALPRNFFIIGTINVDETTYMFSPKVLDRANVIEFKVGEADMTNYLNTSPSIDIEAVCGLSSSVAKGFVSAAKSAVALSKEANDALKAFFTPLKSVNAEFGYRTAGEVGRFVSLAKDDMGADTAIDAAIVQKLLPKLHGSRKKVLPVLEELWKLSCGTTERLEDHIVPSSAKYPLSADKVMRMHKGAIENGFTSFAEA